MNARSNSIACMFGLSVMALAGTAQGQLTEQYASGLLHTSVGGATLGPVVDRRLTVSNIGSSGQDGVEVKLRTMWGGGVGVGLHPLSGGGGGGGAGGMLRTKYKGWDGLIYHKSEVQCLPGGQWIQTVDFSDMGATALRVITTSGGQVVSDDIYPGPIYARPIEPDCPPPSVPTMWYWKRWDANQGKYVYQWMYTCLDHVTLNGDHYQDDMRVIPVLPVGSVDDEPTESFMITANVPEIEVVDAQLMTFDVSAYGIGEGELDEECAGGTPCAVAARRIRSSGIGSSGQDGVAVDLGGGSAGGSISFERKKDGYDLKENTKAYDDEGTVMMRVGRAPSTISGENSAMELDFSSVGDGSVQVEYFDADHNPLGSQFCIPNVGGTVVLDPSWMCFPPTYAVYGYNYNTGKWTFLCCAGGFDIVLPSGETIGPVASMELTPTSDERHRLRSFEVTGSSVCEDIVINAATAVPCAAEVSGDGIIDLSDFFQFLNDFDSGAAGADIDGVPGVDLNDFFTFLNSFDQGC